MSFPFIVNLSVMALSARPVNSDVRHASLKQDISGLGDVAQKTNAALNDTITGRSNNSFDASGISVPLIDNLAVPQMLPAASIRAFGVSDNKRDGRNEGMRVRDVTTIKDALELMRCEQVHRLPVVNSDGVLQGILSINDVVLHPDKRRGTLPAPPEEASPAFDEEGRSPVERIFNEQEED